MRYHVSRRILGTFLLVILSIVTGCNSGPIRGNDSIQGFAQNVLDTARKGDASLLVENLTSYSDSDLAWIRQQAGAAAKRNQPKSDEVARKASSVEDVELWLNSYADLFVHQVSYTSRKTIPSSTGAEVYSLIIWVEDGDKYSGIMISYIAKIRDQFKAIQWVTLSGREAYYGVKKKRAILVANDASECKYPRGGIQYQTEQ